MNGKTYAWLCLTAAHILSISVLNPVRSLCMYAARVEEEVLYRFGAQFPGGIPDCWTMEEKEEDEGESHYPPSFLAAAASKSK